MKAQLIIFVFLPAGGELINDKSSFGAGLWRSLRNFLIRNVVGQVKSTFDLREVIDNKKILIMNLSKGRIGEDTMQLLGSMIVTKLYLAAMSRVDVPEKERQDFYLYVDEFQNFATDSFADILSEARKYRLNLIMAHQFIEQLPENVAAAVFGNIGTLICFRVGAADAEKLVKEFTPIFLEEDLVNLPAFSIYLKLMIDGISSDPFSADTLPPLFDEYRSKSTAKVIKVSRERYANSRESVEDKINRWSGMDLSEKMVATSEGKIDFERLAKKPGIFLEKLFRAAEKLATVTDIERKARGEPTEITKQTSSIEVKLPEEME